MKQDKAYLVKTLLIVSIAISFSYIVLRTALFLFSEYTVIEKVFAVLLIVAELFVIIHGIGYALNILRSYLKAQKQPQKEIMARISAGENPSVAVLVAARHEPKDILENTFIALKNLNYNNKDIYFLDDSSDEKYKREAEELSKEYGLILFRRDKRHGAKAGIINDCLKTLNHKYVAVFDADQNPLSEFLNVLVAIMEKNEKLAFIQTPQFYSNITENAVARGAAFQQAVFYEYICEGKSTSGAMFCCGTNVIFRRIALCDVGGLDESTVTEDFATSIKFHTKGWKSLYYNHVYAFGIGPEDLTGYFKQQFRWAAGTIAVFKKLIWQFLTKPFSMNLIQWWEYFISSSYYLIGLAFFILMICPITYILFKVPSFFIRQEIYMFAFLPYIIISIAVFYSVLRNRNYKGKDLFLGQLLGVVTFSVYIRAGFCALLGIKTTFGITEKGKTKTIPYIKLWPQITLVFLNFAVLIWGINRFIYEKESAILTNTFWVFYHFIILSGIFYFNAAQNAEIACKRLPKRLKFEYKVVEKQSSYDKDTWKTCISIFLQEKLEPGALIMMKLYLPENNKVIIFDANIMWSCAKSLQGFETGLGIVAISQTDKNQLTEFLNK